MTAPRRLCRNNIQLVEIGLVSITAGLTGLALWNYVAITPSLTATLVETYPVSIPWLQDQAACEKTDRFWHSEQCWDNQHDLNF